MKITSGSFFFSILLFVLLCGTAGAFAEGSEMNGSYRTEEIWCRNGSEEVYGIAYIPDRDGKFPLVIFSHELGNNHQSGIR